MNWTITGAAVMGQLAALICALSVVLGTSSTADAGTVLRCVGNGGEVTYSDRPLAEGVGKSCTAVSVSGNVGKRLTNATPVSPPEVALPNVTSASPSSATGEDVGQNSGRMATNASSAAGGGAAGGGGGGSASAAVGGGTKPPSPGGTQPAPTPAGPTTAGDKSGGDNAGSSASAPVIPPPSPVPAAPPPYGRYTARPVAGLVAESMQFTVASASVKQCTTAVPAIVAPSVSVDDFGAKGDGVTDDTAAINKAIESMSGGGTVVFTPGKTYLKRGLIVVRTPGVKLWGYAATIYSVITDEDVLSGKGGARVAIYLSAPNTGIYGLTLISNLRTRLIGHPNNAGVYLMSDSQEAIDNRFEYTGNGVLITGTNFLVARNVVYRTWADGIHMTQDGYMGLVASVGRVFCNVVRQTGDDMIAVVDYGLGQPQVGNISIEGNDVSGQYSGRGITVVGGRDITIRQNAVSYTRGAGILVNSEGAYQTANVNNVLVEDNQLKEIETTTPTYNPLGTAGRIPGQGAIDVNAQLASQTVSQVLIRNNFIDHAAKDGVSIRNNSHDIGVVDNTFRTLGRDAVRIETSTSGVAYCSGNNLNGTVVTNPQCTAPPPTVTGAQL